MFLCVTLAAIGPIGSVVLTPPQGRPHGWPQGGQPTNPIPLAQQKDANMTETTTALGAAAQQLHQAGWHPLPLPHNRKAPPPSGLTGGDGQDLTADQISETHWNGNLGARLPHGVIALDIDQYKTGRALQLLKLRITGYNGNQRLTDLLRQQMASTWISTGRGQPGLPSGAYLYRLNDPETSLCDPPYGTDYITRTHRYLCVSPSQVHTPEADRDYRWWPPNTQTPQLNAPQIAEIPLLDPQLETILSEPAPRIGQWAIGARIQHPEQYRVIASIAAALLARGLTEPAAAQWIWDNVRQTGCLPDENPDQPWTEDHILERTRRALKHIGQPPANDAPRPAGRPKKKTARWEPLQYANHIAETHHIETDLLGRLWKYQPNTGHYTNEGVEAFVHRITAQLIQHPPPGLPPEPDRIYRHRHGTEIVNIIQTRPPKIGIHPPAAITTKNRTIKFRADGGIKIVKHNPKHHITIHLPHKYRPKAQHPQFTKFLNEILPEPGDQLLLQQWAGATLNPNRQNPKGAPFIYGPADAGKSVLCDILTNLYGPENTVGETPHTLTDDKFRALNLQGALANIVPDIPVKTMDDPSIFKMITGGLDRISVRKMYSQTTIRFWPTAGNLFTGNDIPGSWTDTTDGYYARQLALKAQTVPPENRNPKLPQNLAAEISGILNWAIAGHQNLADNNWKWQISEGATRRMAQAYEDAHPEIVWANERTIPIEGERLNQKEAGDDYRDWLRARGEWPQDKDLDGKARGRFYRALKKHWDTIPFQRRTWTGIALLADQPEPDDHLY